MPKYSRNFSPDVCQLSPPTNNFPGAVSLLRFGVDLPDEPLPPLDAWLLLLLVLVIRLLVLLLLITVALTGIKALCKSTCSTVFASMTPLKIKRKI